MPEGRVLNLNNAFVYEYQYKDHLGNLRVSFREANQVQYVASSELSNASAERTQFANVDATRQDKPLFAGQKACRTTNTEPLGFWKSMPITKGDKVKVNAQAFYQGDAVNRPINWNTFFYLNPSYGKGIINGENFSNPHNVLNMVGVGIIPTFSGNASVVPKSYLVAYFFDKNDVIYKQVIRYITKKYQNTWLSLPEIDEEVLQNGRVEIFVANESNINVFFDNLAITHTPQLISQENHYYAFGMNAKEIEKEGSNRFQFMGVEKESSFGLDWTETDHRSYDSEVGRFWQVDKLTELYETETGYHYVSNNPISGSDPSGLCDGCPSNAKQGDKYDWEGTTFMFDNGKWIHQTIVQLDEVTVTPKNDDEGTKTNNNSNNTQETRNKNDNLRSLFDTPVAPFIAWNSSVRWKYTYDVSGLSNLYTPNNLNHPNNEKGINKRTTLKDDTRKKLSPGFKSIFDIVEGKSDKKKNSISERTGKLRQFHTTNKLYNRVSMGTGALGYIGSVFAILRITTSSKPVKEALITVSGYGFAAGGMVLSAPVGAAAGVASSPFISPFGGAMVGSGIVYGAGATSGYLGEEFMKWLLNDW